MPQAKTGIEDRSRGHINRDSGHQDELGDGANPETARGFSYEWHRGH
jgi:hypothetical protein